MMSHFSFNGEKTISAETSADFFALIKSIQFLTKHAIPHYRSSKDYSLDVDLFFKNLKEHKTTYTDFLCKNLGYSQSLALQDFDLTIKHFSENPVSKKFNPAHSLPQGLIAVYGSWSSPAYRFVHHVLRALSSECSVLLFCEPEASEVYCFLAELLAASALGQNRIVILPITDKDVVSTLLDHPSVRAVAGQTHLHNSALLRDRVLSPEKNYSLHFGAHNPVIFLNDHEDAHVDALLKASLQYHIRSEVRFNRWFVQDKIYPDFIEKLNARLQKLQINDFGKMMVENYRAYFTEQQKELSKTKHWLLKYFPESFNVCSDFSNCSPLHQTELLGSLITITRFKNGPEATKFAGTTNHANATCIVTASPEKYLELAQQQQTPFVFLNHLPDVFDSSLSSGDRHCSLATTELAHVQPRIILNSNQYSHSHSTGCC